MAAADSLTVLHLSPHPDDEAIGAGASLWGMIGAGHHVINVACSLGRPEDEERRGRELEEAERRAGFELILHDPLLGIGSGDDRDIAQRQLAATVGDLIAARDASIVMAPSPHDGHHGHEVVGRAARDAVEQCGRPVRLWMWGLWADLPWPTLYYGFGDDELRHAIWVLEAHEQEVERNDYRALVRGRAEANRSLGAERVFGFGKHIRPEPYAELMTEACFRDGEWWTNGARVLDPRDPLREPLDENRERARPIGWWLHARSFRDQVEAARV